MKHFFKLSQISLFASIFLTSCLGTKFLKEDQKILAKQQVVGVSGTLEDGSEGLFVEERNTRFLSVYPFTHLAHLYKLGENGFLFINGYNQEKVIAKRDSLAAKYDRRIAAATKEARIQKLRGRKAKKFDKKQRKVKQGNQVMRWGEPLAVYNHNNARITVQKIKQYLGSEGYFNSEVVIDTADYDSLGPGAKFGRNTRNWVSGWFGKKDAIVNLNYRINLNHRFVIDSIEYQIEDPVLKDLISENLENSPLQKGYYKQQILTDEREYIYKLAVDNGYYDFSKQYISFRVDSVQLGKDTLIVREVIKNPIGKDHHQIYYLDSIVFISEANTASEFRGTTEKYRDISFKFDQTRYSKKVLEWRIPLEQDDRYSRDLTVETQRQLSFLDNFKFININYDTTGNYFIANILTSPFDKYQTSTEVGLSSTQGRPGPFVNLNLKNRNTFRALEILSLDANIKLEDLRAVQEGVSDFDGIYTSRQFGAEAALSFPQFLFPLGDYYKNRMGRFNPKTRLALSFSFEDRVNEYRRTEYQASWSYSWQTRDQVRYIFTPLEVSYTDSRNSDAFEEYLEELTRQGNNYANSFRSAAVNSSAFQVDLSYGEYGQGQAGTFIRFSTEWGGYLNRVAGEALFGENIETFQFLLGQLDMRRISRISRKLNFAYRLNMAYAHIYGSNNSLPYDRSFFAGGSSSIRAWKPRRLGPGAYGIFQVVDGAAIDEVDYSREQPGEILIEASAELRQDLAGFLEGALFVDAGNVWLVKSSTVTADADGDDGTFDFNNFAKEIAVGAGIGLRFDLQFLIFRVDLGVKMFDPAQKEGERWVGNQLFSNFGPLSEINIGIGYPF